MTPRHSRSRWAAWRSRPWRRCSSPIRGCAAFDDRLPRVSRAARAIVALRRRTIGLLLAGCAAAWVAAGAWEAVAFPRGDLRADLRAAYGPRLHADRPPLLVAAELGRE